MQKFSHGLGGQGLADAGDAMEQEDDAATLALNDVLERARVVLNQSPGHVLEIVFKHEVVEGVVVPLNFLELVDFELSPGLRGH